MQAASTSTTSASGGGSSFSAPLTAAEESAATSQAVLAAATELTAILEAAETLDAGTAQEVAGFVSLLIEEEIAAAAAAAAAGGGGQGDGDVNEQSASQITAAVHQLARAVTAAAGAGQVIELTSSNLNLTAEARDIDDLSTHPVECDTSGALPTTVALPPNVLDAVPGIDASQPVSLVLFASAANLHRRFQGVDGRRRRQRALSSAVEDGEAGEATSHGSTSSARRKVSASSMVSFSVLQGGAELRVHGSASPINVSIPFERPDALEQSAQLAGGGVAGTPPCIGAPENATLSRCSTAIECRWWDGAGNGSWSTAGCTTIAAADGRSFDCSCDHLTDFMIFEFPTVRRMIP